MRNDKFTHLHLHTEYSLLDGFGKPEAYVEKAANMGFTHIAITDHANIDGFIKMQKACNKHSIRPIFGCELYVVPNMLIKEKEKRFHMTVFVKNEIGFKNLCSLLSIASTDGYYYRPRADYKTILKYKEGLIISTACSASFLNEPDGVEFIEILLDDGFNDIFFEVMPHNFDGQKRLNKIAITYAERLNLPIIATNDCHYPDRDDNICQEVLLAIQTRKKWNDSSRWRFEIDGLYLRSSNSMIKAFEDQCQIPRTDAIKYLRNTQLIVDRCDFVIEQKPISLPTPYEKVKNYNKKLRDLCFESKKKHLLDSQEYKDRFQEEFKLICSKDFSLYFLIVHDLIQWCKKPDISILVGPGRGSVGGSLIAYLLDATEIDPIKHNLLFSRFIAEHRNDYPDIDIDFEHIRIKEIYDYLEAKYGYNHIAGISSFIRMKDKAVIRDVCRVFDVPSKEVDSFAKDKIIDSLDNVEDCAFTNEHASEYSIACRLNGTAKSYGKHAAGIVVSKDDLSESGQCVLSHRDHLMINWEMADTEFMGLMKLDALSLNTLSILNEAKRIALSNDKFMMYHEPSDCLYVDRMENNKNAIEIDLFDFDFSNIKDLTDPDIIAFFTEGNTNGIFQFNTWALTNLCKEMKPETFEEMVAIVALVRPGPMNSGMTTEYIRRKEAGTWEKKHPIYEDITKETYGCIVYQEQVMKCVYQLAGLSYSIADKVRKIIGKKRDIKEFNKYKRMFIGGCVKNKTLSSIEASELWSAFEEHASYSFNKCLTGDTIVYRTASNKYSSREVTIKELYENFISNTSVGSKYRCGKLTLFSYDKTIKHNFVKSISKNGFKIVFQITTKSGKTIKATENHKFLTHEGYKKVKNLTTDDFIVATDFVKVRSEKYVRKGLAIRGQGVSYEGKGFQEKESNPSYIDGRTKNFEKMKEIVTKKAEFKCEFCNKEKEGRFEFAHIRKKEYFETQIEYDSPQNVLFLCNSCHKKFDYAKGERVKRFARSYKTYEDQIIKIEFLGEEQTYDIEMAHNPHNFIANGLVSHNSHSTAYTILAYWCGFCKKYLPVEFICANLTYGADSQKQKFIDEAISSNLKIIEPSLNSETKAYDWHVKNDCLYIPFKELKGVGDKVAEQLEKHNDNSSGGFMLSAKPKKAISKKIIDLITNREFEYGDFKVSFPETTKDYPNLTKLFGEFFPADLEDVLTGSLTPEMNITTQGFNSKAFKIVNRSLTIQKKSYVFDEALTCSKCSLRKEATQVVQSSPGLYNVSIINEAPGKLEDKKGIAFYGESGDLLWNTMSEHGLDRQMFNIKHVCKCYPSISKVPDQKQIKSCSYWLKKELDSIDCRLALVFGNTGLRMFENERSGILQWNGNTLWNDKWKMWVCWCIHPALVRSDEDKYMPVFKEGIENFISVFEKFKKQANI